MSPMNNEPTSSPTLETLDERPRQFGLSHLMIGVTVAAVLCAILAPLLQVMTPGNRVMVLLMFLLQGTLIGGSYYFLSSQREHLLRDAGRRIGVGYNGQIPGKRWPVVLPLFVMGVFAVGQLALAIWAAMMSTETLSWTNVIQQAQMGVFGGVFLSHLRRGGSPWATEFFENGVMVAGTGFTPWERIQLRPSQLADDRLVMISRGEQKHFGGTTATILVDRALREYLLAHYGRSDNAA